MAGYTRADTANNISNGSVVDADDLDAEFNSIEAAFNSSTGHTHDGTSAEGSAITVTGPSQEYVHSATALTPKTDNTYDLGSLTNAYKDIHISGVAYLADIDLANLDSTIIGATTPAAITGTTVTATTGFVGSVTGNVTGDLTGNADTATALETARTFSATGDVTATAQSFDGTGNVTLTTVVVDDSHNHTLSTVTDAGTIASQDADAVAITGGAVDGTAIGGTTPAAGAFTSLTYGGTALTATAAELNILDGVTWSLTDYNTLTATASEINTVTSISFGDAVTLDEATTADYRAATADKLLTTDQVWDSGAVVSLTDGASIALDMSSGFNFSVTLGGNRTLANPSNLKVGQTGFIRVTQDATGSRTLTLDTYYKTQNGLALTLSTAANDEDVLFYCVLSSTEVLVNPILGVA